MLQYPYLAFYLRDKEMVTTGKEVMRMVGKVFARMVRQLEEDLNEDLVFYYTFKTNKKHSHKKNCTECSLKARHCGWFEGLEPAACF